MLWVASGLAFVGGMPQLGVAIIAVILFNGLFSFAQEYRAERAIRALSVLLPATAVVRRDGCKTTVPVSELVSGGIVLLDDNFALVQPWGAAIFRGPLRVVAWAGAAVAVAAGGYGVTGLVLQLLAAVGRYSFPLGPRRWSPGGGCPGTRCRRGGRRVYGHRVADPWPAMSAQRPQSTRTTWLTSSSSPPPSPSSADAAGAAPPEAVQVPLGQGRGDRWAVASRYR